MPFLPQWKSTRYKEVPSHIISATEIRVLETSQTLSVESLPQIWVFIFRLLLEKKFADFHYPATEEEYPGYKEVIQRPMDVATLLRGVDGGEYPAKALFLADVDLIAENAKVGDLTG